jgi:hypothetical protein
MTTPKNWLCPCRSGLPWWNLFDASGIYCCRVCAGCEAKQKAKYRPEIFTDSNYETDEPKEPEE